MTWDGLLPCGRPPCPTHGPSCIFHDEPDRCPVCHSTFKALATWRAQGVAYANGTKFRPYDWATVHPCETGRMHPMSRRDQIAALAVSRREQALAGLPPATASTHCLHKARQDGAQ